VGGAATGLGAGGGATGFTILAQDIFPPLSTSLEGFAGDTEGGGAAGTVGCAMPFVVVGDSSTGGAPQREVEGSPAKDVSSLSSLVSPVSGSPHANVSSPAEASGQPLGVSSEAIVAELEIASTPKDTPPRPRPRDSPRPRPPRVPLPSTQSDENIQRIEYRLILGRDRHAQSLLVLIRPVHVPGLLSHRRQGAQWSLAYPLDSSSSPGPIVKRGL
jgi:hypothetical protein